MFNRKIRVIFFDAGDTLFHIKTSVGEIYGQLAAKYGFKTDPQIINSAFVIAFKSKPPLAFPNVELSAVGRRERDWWFSLVHEVFNGIGTFPRFNDYFDELFEEFRGSNAWELYPETKSTLDELKNRGYTVSIISNFDSRIYDVCKSLQIDQYITSIFVSSREGSAKPDPGIFESALRKSHVSRDEALHVGDSLVEDVHGAQASGITPLLLDRERRFKDLTDVIRIRDLSELITVLNEPDLRP